MSAISIIYRRELGTYLRSPIGWVIAAVVLLVDGILFQAFALSGESLSADVLMRFFMFSGIMTAVAGIVLAFRLLSEERQNHSMVLLNTSPIRDVDIVLGKFFAALTFLALMLALSMYMPLLIKVHGHVTWSQILVGYFGLLLFGATSLAVGIFASAITRYQLVAALVGAFVMFVLCYVYLLAKRLDPPVRETLEQVDLWWVRYQNGFMRGVLNLKDVIAYLATTYFFLLLATKTLETKRWQ
jgi:ABC-2 type transport system permease protein